MDYMTKKLEKLTGKLKLRPRQVLLLDLTGDETVEMLSPVEKYLKMSHQRIWPSKDLKTFHWIYMPPEPSSEVASGSAATVELAEDSILHAAEVHLASN